MLFLYRSFFPDSGGDGEHRGGRAAGTAWTPHGVERLRNTLSSHGVEVPVSYGQFGGWPGACNRQMVVRDTGVREKLLDGELPMALEDLVEPIDFDALGGDRVTLEAKQDEFALSTGDVVQYTWQGGGGYGEPLDRDPAAVERDVADGLVSATHAAEAYGVVPGDEAATAIRRKDLRAGRLDGTASPAAEAVPEDSILGRYGPALLVLDDGDGAATLACRCGHRFCSAEENWKQQARRLPVATEDLPHGVAVHRDLELAQYVCPACGRLHAVEVEERGEPPLQDMKLIGKL
jgi:N-methylhydantoinase B